MIQNLLSTFGVEAPPDRLYNGFNYGRRSLTEENREGNTRSIMSENIDAVPNLIIQDRPRRLIQP